MRVTRVQDELTKILKLGLVWHCGVLCGRMRDCGVSCAGKVQELVYLVAADITQNAAKALALKEPVRAGFEVFLVRAQSDRLDNLADGTGLNQLTGARDGRHLKAF